MQDMQKALKTLMIVAVAVLVLAHAATGAAQSGNDIYGEDKPADGQKAEKGFKVGKLRLHPGLSLQNVFDSNVSNASPRYNDPAYLATFPRSATSPQVNYDDILHIIGAFKLNYPDDKVAVTMDLMADYTRYFGVDNSETTALSGLTGMARLTVNLFRKSVAGFTIEDVFTRSVQPQQVGLSTTYDRIHNKAAGTLHIRPGGGQLRFDVGYYHELERYDEARQINLNWMQHNFLLDWQLEFFPKTAFFMAAKFGMRDYYEFDPTVDNGQTNTQRPNAMPLKVVAGVMGRITSKFLLNVAVGYGNSFSENYENFNSVVGKLELIGQFTRTTVLKGGFERGFNPITTYSYQADNKIYLEFKQWLFSDKFKIYLYGSYSFLQYGPADQTIDLDIGGGTLRLPETRNDRVMTLTPSLRYDFLAWLNMEVGYTFTWRDTDYWIRRVDSDEGGSDYYLGDTFYNYFKHQVFLKLTLAY